ncbi:MAG TPA: hypothetical protein VFW00_12985, partial [Rhodocyclaceae bacterium]|nr:hypothetical protein [Rhodocyclaceae bacterium]
GDVHPPEAAFFTARGHSIRDIDPNRFDADRLRARRNAYAALLLSGGHSTPPTPTAEAREEAARKNALATIEILKQQLEPLLHALARDSGANLSAQLRPRSEDYAKAFTANIADAARTAYESLWDEAPRVEHTASNSKLICHIAPAGMLVDDNELSRFFPGGYRSIAPLLVANRVWVAWKYIAPGQTAGMAYDGLVWLDDHWAWLPKPYRVLGKLIQ